MFKRALVTAGGTTEAIDDVRFVELVSVDGVEKEALRLTHLEITNISTGGFCSTIAKILEEKGVQTTLLSRDRVIEKLQAEGSTMKLKSFRSAKELLALMHEELASGTYDLILMGAAVADYAPVKVEGKISSDNKRISVEFEANPKILDTLRVHAGKSCTIVGFKLTSGASDEMMDAISWNQIARVESDLCIANDIKRINFDTLEHPVRIVHPKDDGRVIPLFGHRNDVAQGIVEHLLSEHSKSQS